MIKLKNLAWLAVPVLLIQGCAPAVVGGAATGAAVAYDRRTTGTVIDDQGIEFKAAYALFDNKEIYDQSHINVTSFNGVVLLTGETPSESLKQKATAEVKQIPKVRRIHNELAIAAPSALPSRSTDTWITSKIKAKMATDEHIDPFHIKVVTERGIVYLLGLVSRAEAQQAVNLVTNTAGVQRVVKIFEYTD
ncbi:BON domain-containing protein [Methylophaga sp.]|jgi:osmotically-inducible protein OsmY|uniref:BON domain-containing protein n=1 Tax=Methylophaga sp. TaxID=2024840 RepID=UPI0013FF1E65|nr:BON domain-containing protein [Methylophaga sp.]MTI64294.1 BON domain-containing protein [Methylophaga sp.]